MERYAYRHVDITADTGAERYFAPLSAKIMAAAALAAKIGPFPCDSTGDLYILWRGDRRESDLEDRSR